MKPNHYSFRRTAILAVITFVATFAVTYAQTKTTQLDELLNKYTEYGQFNGSVLVADKGQVIYKKGFGMANMEWDIPNTPDTKHRLGSITKQFTSMLIMQLVAEGKLDLQATVSKYLPDYSKVNGDKITIHQLLTHTSGTPNYTSFPNFFKDLSQNPHSPTEMLALFGDLPLEFTPGERFAYSNSGYILLGAIIEKVTGKTYEEVLQEKIFDPLKMKDSGYDHHNTILKKRATGYEMKGSTPENSPYIDMSTPYAAGSLYSTVEDLYLWDQALYTDKLLSKKYMDMLFEKYIPAFGEYYGYGWMIGEMPIGNTKDTVKVVTHGGGINGFNTLITREIEDKSLVVLLNNTGGAPLYSINVAISAILKGKTYDMPKQSLADLVLNKILDKDLNAGLEFYKKNKDSKLYSLEEDDMNSIGYTLLQAGKINEAEAIFKLNVEAFPKSSNVYDSYGEALMEQGKNELAIINYKKSVELNPANESGIAMLKKLGVETEDMVKDVSVPDAILESYVGKYELQPGFILTITKEGSQLNAQATGQPMAPIFPKSETEFYLKVVTAQIIFKKNAAGAVESLTLFQGGQEIVGKRI
ncbi:penicillin-binding protein, beta-lactamase class C [Aequorivita sublithincola DSM 14238]|uniref:Penicillin-binding protein, beta-lactamase class C n=1 Tax=Aequorivita sublithincola (strain DSM 14238 / LMG 21431 / ACAM 643 / 9-3) TaxID=746697 RepID=I3YW74_AEQSU|nr:serine hydrolase [Aequorivita sublithincola]AFL81242.1 penicillin-binding protein, beta-lactamase class C [Aequorivita sublithincola DSM 14238]